MRMAPIPLPPPAQQPILRTPRAPWLLRNVHVREGHVDRADHHVLPEVVGIEHGAVHVAAKLPTRMLRPHAVLRRLWRGYRTRRVPRGVVSGRQELVVGRGEGVVGGAHPAHDAAGGAAHRVAVDVVSVAEDGEEAELDGRGAAEEGPDARGDGLAGAQRDGRDGVAAVDVRAVGGAAPDLPGVRDADRVVDGGDVGRVHAPSRLWRFGSAIAGPCLGEVVVLDGCEPGGVYGHHVVSSIECRAAGVVSKIE